MIIILDIKKHKKVGRKIQVNILIIKQLVIIRVFPIYIGINRINSIRILQKKRVPYIHRDKPAFRIYSKRP